MAKKDINFWKNQTKEHYKILKKQPTKKNVALFALHWFKLGFKIALKRGNNDKIG